MCPPRSIISSKSKRFVLFSLSSRSDLNACLQEAEDDGEEKEESKVEGQGQKDEDDLEETSRQRGAQRDETVANFLPKVKSISPGTDAWQLYEDVCLVCAGLWIGF